MSSVPFLVLDPTSFSFRLFNSFRIRLKGHKIEGSARQVPLDKGIGMWCNTLGLNISFLERIPLKNNFHGSMFKSLI